MTRVAKEQESVWKYQLKYPEKIFRHVQFIKLFCATPAPYRLSQPLGVFWIRRLTWYLLSNVTFPMSLSS